MLRSRFMEARMACGVSRAASLVAPQANKELQRRYKIDSYMITHRGRLAATRQTCPQCRILGRCATPGIPCRIKLAYWFSRRQQASKHEDHEGADCCTSRRARAVSLRELRVSSPAVFVHGLTAIANGTGLRYRGSRSAMQENHRGHEYLACFRKQEVETQIHRSEGMHTDGALVRDVGQCRFSPVPCIGVHPVRSAYICVFISCLRRRGKGRMSDGIQTRNTAQDHRHATFRLTQFSREIIKSISGPWITPVKNSSRLAALRRISSTDNLAWIIRTLHAVNTVECWPSSAQPTENPRITGP